jgi:hypothetical protein
VARAQYAAQPIPQQESVSCRQNKTRPWSDASMSWA